MLILSPDCLFVVPMRRERERRKKERADDANILIVYFRNYVYLFVSYFRSYVSLDVLFEIVLEETERTKMILLF